MYLFLSIHLSIHPSIYISIYIHPSMALQLLRSLAAFQFLIP
jgi:hypothetical protein